MSNSSTLSRRKRTFYPYNRYSILLFVVPFIALYLVFRIWPIVYAAALSLHQWQGLGPWNFVGFSNYTRFLTDANALQTVMNTAIMAGGELLIGIPLGFTLALVLDSPKVPFRSALRTIYFLPRVVALAVAAITFGALFQRQYGAINYIISLFGLTGIPWLRDPNWARLAVVITRSWVGVGFTMIYFTAGLQGIPRDLYEAADIDGAQGIQKLMKITIPMLRRVILFVTVIGTVGAFQLFVVPYMMTGGGPARATTPVMMYILSRGVGASNYGFASAITILMTAFLAIVAAIQFKIAGRD